MDKDKIKQIEVFLETLETQTNCLKENLSVMQDINSSFPATREFLEENGYQNVKELDEKGPRNLKLHLVMELLRTSLKNAEKINIRDQLEMIRWFIKDWDREMLGELSFLIHLEEMTLNLKKHLNPPSS